MSFFDRKVFISAVRQSLQIFYIMKRKGCPDWEWKMKTYELYLIQEDIAKAYFGREYLF